ncbi:hypothetical protein [Runella sp.]|uniref:hypothetical protein n=1 Tax=Runella sp. TaxID=1960881 RepID=UPI003D0D6F1A
MYTFKILALWIVIGMALGGLIAFIVTKFDGYYDGLLVKQTILLGAPGGLLIAGLFLYVRSQEAKGNPITTRSVVESVLKKTAKVEQPKIQATPKPAKPKSFWSFLWRGGLMGFVGSIAGLAAGIAFCVNQYEGMSSDAKAWVIFYVPFFFLYLCVGAVIGLLLGSLSGIVWNYFRA